MPKAKGQVVSVQRVYLDEKTAGKNTFLKDPKLTKGSNKGAPGVIQTGTKGGALYLAEGPETAASLASLDKNATVLVSFSVSNIANTAEVIKSYEPKQVFIAADNDGNTSASRKTTEKACLALRDQGIDARIVYPDMLKNREKTDWNDVLVEKGLDALKNIFQEKIAATQSLYEKGTAIQGTLAEQYFKAHSELADLVDVRFLAEISFKGQKVPAMMLPCYNAQGLLSGEMVLALSEDGEQIIGKGQIKGSKEDFYVAQRGKGELLIIADTPLNAKTMAKRHTDATVVLGKPDDSSTLPSYLSKQGITPTKVMIVSDSPTREQQMRATESSRGFHAKGAELFLMNAKGKATLKLDIEALEKAHLKMSFEKLLAQKPEKPDLHKGLSAQTVYDSLKKNYPILINYERDSRAKKEAYGYGREQLEKTLLGLAKEIMSDKNLLNILRRVVPELADSVVKRVRLSQEQDKGIRR